MVFFALLENNKIVNYKIHSCLDYLDAPTWRQAFEFFAENNGLFHKIEIESSMQDGQIEFIPIVDNIRLNDEGNYIDAVSSCFDKMIELVQSTSNEW